MPPFTGRRSFKDTAAYMIEECTVQCVMCDVQMCSVDACRDRCFKSSSLGRLFRGCGCVVCVRVCGELIGH